MSDTTRTPPPARLILEDGTVLVGRGFGSEQDRFGELVFNTSMTGYQEIASDPSYRGQVVLLTQPHIGNQGINEEDEESRQPWLSGLVVRELARRPSNFRSTDALDAWLREHGVPAIDRIDTRQLVRRVRSTGEQRCLITRDMDTPESVLVARVKGAPHVGDEDHVRAVSVPEPTPWTQAHESEFSPEVPAATGSRPRLPIVAYDFGAKRNILRSLVAHDLDVTVVPADTPAAAVLERKPQGIFLSNGPGDPAVVDYAVQAVEQIVQAGIPTFGICLGHQVLGQVFGLKTFKMRFGHHGGNHPVMDLTTEKVEITAQNHSFAVDGSSLPDSIEITHKNLNDGTIEGLRHKELPAFGVQYHPEAAPGPHDALYLFERFRQLIEQHS